MNRRQYLLTKFQELFPQFEDDIGTYKLDTQQSIVIKSKSSSRVYTFTFKPGFYKLEVRG